MSALRLSLLSTLIVAGLAACGSQPDQATTPAAPTAAPAAPAAAAQVVQIDGSSTVYPISEAIAEEFQIQNQGSYKVTVGVSGTGGGFKKFCRGELDIANASRPIQKSEMETCAAAGITPISIVWWLIVGPGLALGCTCIALNFLGDGLRDALDPRLKHR